METKLGTFTEFSFGLGACDALWWPTIYGAATPPTVLWASLRPPSWSLCVCLFRWLGFRLVWFVCWFFVFCAHDGPLVVTRKRWLPSGSHIRPSFVLPHLHNLISGFGLFSSLLVSAHFQCCHICMAQPLSEFYLKFHRVLLGFTAIDLGCTGFYWICMGFDWVVTGFT